MKREIFEKGSKVVAGYNVREIRWTNVYIFVHTYEGKVFKRDNDGEYTTDGILSIVE
jgi:hypothetical protein